MIHDRRYFYKYMSAETALQILQTRTLMYSSPLLFNDPFDVQTTVDFGFTLTEYDKAFREEIFRFIQSNEEPTCVNPDSEFEDLMLLRRLNRISPMISIEILEQEIKPFLEEQAGWYSGPCRPLIPIDVDHPFQSMPSTDSGDAVHFILGRQNGIGV